jgi:hypothetical protein
MLLTGGGGEESDRGECDPILHGELGETADAGSPDGKAPNHTNLDKTKCAREECRGIIKEKGPWTEGTCGRLAYDWSRLDMAEKVKQI